MLEWGGMSENPDVWKQTIWVRVVNTFIRHKTAELNRVILAVSAHVGLYDKKWARRAETELNVDQRSREIRRVFVKLKWTQKRKHSKAPASISSSSPPRKLAKHNARPGRPPAPGPFDLNP